MNVKVKPDVTSVETVEMDVQTCIEEFCDREGIENLRKVPQTVYAACIEYVGRRLFKHRSFMKDKTLIPTEGAAIPYVTNNRTDMDRIDALVDYYRHLCRMYDKVFTLSGVCDFMGLSWDFFRNPKRNYITRDGVNVREKVYRYSEDTASEALIGGSRAPMSVLPYLNHYHGWQRDVSSASEEKVGGVLSGAELPRLSGE